MSTWVDDFQMRHVLLEFKNIFHKKFTEYTNQLSNVSITVYILFILFGLVSWTAANGVLSESPVLTAILPECYRLTSFIVIIVQCANIGPITYLIIWCLVKLAWKKTLFLNIAAIYCTLIFALIASVCIAIFWNQKIVISDVTISLAFFILTGCLAISDCTSTILFLPFVALYPTAYISALYIGEGLSGVVPSLWALVQGSPSRECSQTGSHIDGVRFTPTLYFLVITVITVISLIAFTLILLLPSARRERHKMSAALSNNQSSDNEDIADEETIAHTNSANLSYLNIVQYISIQIILCIFANSFLYSIAPYFTLPYGSSTFLLTLNLTLIAVPIGSLLGGLFNPRKLLTLWCLLAIYLLAAIWLIFLAVCGEQKPMQGSIIGEFHVIVLLSLTGLIAGYVKVGLGVLAKNEGGSTYLLLIAIATQIGSFIGGLAAYLLVNYSQLFSL